MSEQAEIAAWLDASRALIAHQEHLDHLAELRHDNGVPPGTVYYFNDGTGETHQVIVHCGPYAYLPSRWEAAAEGIIETHVFLYDT